MSSTYIHHNSDVTSHFLFLYDSSCFYFSISVNRAKNGVSVIADAGPFSHLHKKDKLVEHELSCLHALI